MSQEKLIKEGLESISIGLDILKQNRRAIETGTGARGVDVAARLSAQVLSLTELFDALSLNIKARALESNDILKGVNYQAEITRESRSILDVQKVQNFLGTQLPLFQITTQDTRVTFNIKD